MKTQKINILQIVPSLSLANGVAAYISNYFINMDKKNIKMTFLVLNEDNRGRYEEIEYNGGEIVELFREKNIINYLKKIDLFFKENKFDIVHCHSPNYGAFFLKYAKKYGIKTRILHSHANKSADKLTHAIRNKLIIPFAVKYANEYFACSKEAGDFLFKKKKYTILNNAINLEKFVFSNQTRKEYRKKLNLENKFVIGSFGRLCPQKNQLFSLDILKQIIELKKDAVLLLVGDGDMKEKILSKAKKLNIQDKVIFLGNRNDIDKLYNCLDTFLLPSTYEGLGIVLIEAQANGLNCFTSLDLVPQVANVASLIEYIPLKNNPKEWADKIIKKEKINKRKTTTNIIKNKGYDIKTEAKKLEEKYKTLFNRNLGE